jgi:hypothetical protein
MGKNRRGREGSLSNIEPTSGTTGSRSYRLKRRRSRRRRRWLAGLASAVLATVLATGLTGGLSYAAHSVEKVLSSSPKKSVVSPQSQKNRKRQSQSKGGASTAIQPNSPICLPKIVSEYPLDSWEVHAWVFPVRFTPSPNQIAQLNENRAAPESINQDLYNDGGYAPFTNTQLVLQNNCPRPVTITDIRAKKVCQSPLAGDVFVGQAKLSEPSSADEGGTQLGFNLDSPDPEAMVTNNWNVSQWTQEYASGSLATIQANNVYSFDIRAIALKEACQFSIIVKALYQSKTFTEILDDDGQQFRVTALLPSVLKQGTSKDFPYGGYGGLYVGWVASPWKDGTWARENPKSWRSG